MKGLPHASDPARPGLDEYADAATKNAISRAGSSSKATQDPTSADERRASAAYVAQERKLADPHPHHGAVQPTAHPTTRRPATRWPTAATRRRRRRWASGRTTASPSARRPAGEPFFLKPTDLGTYLLYGTRPRLPRAAPTAPSPSPPSPAPTPSGSRTGPAPASRSGIDDDRFLAVAGGQLAVAGTGTRFTARRHRPAAPPTPRPRSTSPAPRRPGSRRTRRCAGTSTRTPTAWPSSSSAATCTAAGPGTSTARRTPCRLPRPHRHRRQRRRARGAALGPTHPRPGRLADVQGLAGAGVADPRGHLLPLARALLARRPADLREPARREQPALPALPDQAQLLRRHGLRPPPGEGHARDAGLHRRPVRRARQGLLPDRAQPVGGAAA